ncbi:betaine/proline/choline family ABC transporter ATP-binding protein [Mesorhizobium sp.]|uniref:betaine/proline/choline family ABC transporter ATP-binding protein n=1 Tax=Mesorhizobium sp. TaxID=1871066 RepID=UPI00121A38E2|nr:betaine/proline/choline family ABC transporter ATP-binding protein [Mesorhizobium sp.]TIO26754.1 MAG: ATP-binding cassette domain-containing protein [Mesorhizobium sp.]
MSFKKIEFKNVWKVYAAREGDALEEIKRSRLSGARVPPYVVGVEDVTFDINEGEIFCIIGLSGSGKSTLLRHINGLIKPTAGEVVIDGASINDLSEARLLQLRSQKIGMVFQHVALLPNRTVVENVALGLEIRGVKKAERRQLAQAALERVQLPQWGAFYPDELSGGMQQRVGLARALVTDPEILLMDEPFSALDPIIRRQLQDQFMEISAKATKTTVFITHDIEEAARLGDRIAIMNKGKVEQIGTPQDILLRPATPYVREFVSHVTLLDKLVAGDIMQSTSEVADSLNVACDGSSIDAQTPVAEVIRRGISGTGTLLVSRGGTNVGMIGREEILTFLEMRPDRDR